MVIKTNINSLVLVNTLAKDL